MKLARRSALLVVAVVASFILLACPGPVSEIDATVTCTGDACGKSGDLHIWIEQCGGGDVADVKTLTGVALDPTAPIVVKFKDVSGTGNCVRGFLDRDADATATAGDIIPSFTEADPGESKTGKKYATTLDLDTIVSLPSEATLYLDVSCSGAACGRTGNLVGQVLTCGTAGGAVIASDSTPGVTLSTALRVTISNIPPATDCVRAFLDVDTSGNVSTGDATLASNATVTMTLTSGQTATQALTLDVIAP